ncbi:uncharacterized protein LOC9630442 [Selaginella moellendorffii]|uniref:uncharacterized protein LOC9630442 n=1 Tax=Selaginella moellendorffii TaxID=88036 RepID=UPI000D1C811E|nr:uncharacterized protein LOC9630442 [Selaginella moellendorffii]|eukprot:XP_024539187.1 uncharacterized protein LOC9630442 [Selaginella moellendorffii]
MARAGHSVRRNQSKKGRLPAVICFDFAENASNPHPAPSPQLVELEKALAAAIDKVKRKTISKKTPKKLWFDPKAFALLLSLVFYSSFVGQTETLFRVFRSSKASKEQQARSSDSEAHTRCSGVSIETRSRRNSSRNSRRQSLQV